MAYQYTIEQDEGASVSPCRVEVAMIEAAALLWHGEDDLPDDTDCAAVRFGGVSFTVYRRLVGAES